jgi:hypothetical protein
MQTKGETPFHYSFPAFSPVSLVFSEGKGQKEIQTNDPINTNIVDYQQINWG